jgi:hypothetical protein
MPLHTVQHKLYVSLLDQNSTHLAYIWINIGLPEIAASDKIRLLWYLDEAYQMT